MNYIGKSLIYSMRKAFQEHAVVKLVYKFDEKSYREMFKKVSRSLKYYSNFFLVYKHIYVYTCDRLSENGVLRAENKNVVSNSILRKLPVGNCTGYFTRYIEILREICNSTARVK